MLKMSSLKGLFYLTNPNISVYYHIKQTAASLDCWWLFKLDLKSLWGSSGGLFQLSAIICYFGYKPQFLTWIFKVKLTIRRWKVKAKIILFLVTQTLRLSRDGETMWTHVTAGKTAPYDQQCTNLMCKSAFNQLVCF